MDFGRKIRHGVEAAPIEAPVFDVPAHKPPPVEQPIPGFAPDFTPVPVRLPARRQ